jgi:hypothetical protein
MIVIGETTADYVAHGKTLPCDTQFLVFVGPIKPSTVKTLEKKDKELSQRKKDRSHTIGTRFALTTHLAKFPGNEFLTVATLTLRCSKSVK